MERLSEAVSVFNSRIRMSKDMSIPELEALALDLSERYYVDKDDIINSVFEVSNGI